MEDFQLLREYAEGRSEPAFAELVRRHVNLVFSCALRLTRDAGLAQDAAQMVFIQLAKKAGSIREGTILSGWLYRTTRFVAETILRAERRRRKREEMAMQIADLNSETQVMWKEIGPLLEEAMGQLKQADQDAVLLRFFEGKTLREVGEALGTNDDAAQKRVERALEKLRAYLTRQGVTVGSATLAPVLAAQAVQAAPLGLGSTLVAGTLNGAAGAGVGTFSLNLTKVLFYTKLKAGAFSAVAALVLLVGGGAVMLNQMFALQQQGPIDAARQQELSSAALVLRGRVTSKNGKPVSGALVRVATRDNHVRLYQTNNPAVATSSSAAAAKSLALSATTGTDGKFAIPLTAVPADGKIAVAVNSEAGYALVTSEELSSNPDVVVQPWGWIEGELRIGKSAGANEIVNLGIWGSDSTYDWSLVSHHDSVRTDQNGRFVFTRVAPVDVWLTRTVMVRPGDGRQSGHHYLKVLPGQTNRVKLGGKGYLLTGRIDSEWLPKLVFHGSMWAKQPHSFREPPNWRQMSAGERRANERQWRESEDGEMFMREVRNYEFAVAPDGSFRVPDVLPGAYRMLVRAEVSASARRNNVQAPEAEMNLDLPELPDELVDEPFDVGVLHAKP